MSSRDSLLAVVVVLGCGGGCGGEEEARARPEPAPVEVPAAPDPTLLPAVTPEASPAASVDGFSIEVDAASASPRVTTRSDGAAMFSGNVRYRLVWVGPPTGPEATPWRAAGAVAGCPLPTPAPAPTPIFTWGGAMGAGSIQTNSWDITRDRVSFCRGDQLDGMDPPPGRYRVSATFERADGTVERVLWSQPFIRPPG